MMSTESDQKVEEEFDDEGGEGEEALVAEEAAGAKVGGKVSSKSKSKTKPKEPKASRETRGLFTEWLHPRTVSIYRVVPSKTKSSVSGIERAGIAGLIRFGKEKGSFSAKNITQVPDPYRSSKITEGIEEVEILSDQVPVAQFFNYDITNPVNHLPDISIWPIYRIWHLKQLLSAYIGCPVSHISLLDEDGESLDSYYDSDSFRVPTELIQSVKDLPSDVYMLLLGDWTDRRDVRSVFQGSEGGDSGEGGSAALESIRKSERIRIMTMYAIREKVLADLLHSIKSPGKEPTLHGNVTQTELSAYPSTGDSGEHVIDNERMFGLLQLNKFDPSDMLASNWLTALSYNDGHKVRSKILRNSSGLPERLAPSRIGSLGALILVREKETTVHLHSFLVTVHDDFRVVVASNWAGSEASTRQNLSERSERALKVFLHRIYSHFEEDIMRPGSTLPTRRAMRETLSIVAYQENYTGGNFEEYKDVVTQLARAELVHITYLTSSSIYFQVSQGWSEERLTSLYGYIVSRPTTAGGEAVSLDALREVAGYLMKGPEIQLKSEASELFAMISGCNGDEEIIFCGQLAGAIAAIAGYTASSHRDTKMMRDYANLSLLEQIDPVLFGSRELPGGERINYSRECQGASRHPIPISVDEALKDRSSSVAILNNVTYGGPQGYRAPTKEFPVISFRAVPFQRYCVVCCVQKEIDPSSLRWDEHSECARSMLFDPSSVLKATTQLGSTKAKKDQYYGNPLQFDGNRIVRGRLANFPKGVREHLPPTAFLYSPVNIDSSSLHEVIEWTVGYPIEEPQGKEANPYELMTDYAIHGVPIAFLRLTPESKKSWRASLLELSEFYDVPPFVICLWSSDTNPDSFPISYHPIVSEDHTPLTSDDLKLGIEYGGRERTECGTGKAFTVDMLSSSLPNYTISNTIIFDGYCYAVTVVRRKHIGKGEESGSFLMPVRPARTKIINPIDIKDANLPTVKQIDELFIEIKKAMPYCLIAAKSLIYDEKGYLVAIIVLPDNIVIHVQPSSTLPKELDITNARQKVVSRKSYDMLWGKTKLYLSSPSMVDSPYTTLSLHAAEMYLAAKIVRYGIIDALINAAKIHISSSSDLRGSSSSGSSKNENPRDDYLKILLPECRKFVRIGTSTHISLHNNNIILFSERATLPVALFEQAVTRLAVFCPKNPQLVLPYFKCFGSVLHPEKPSLEEWEKIIA